MTKPIESYTSRYLFGKLRRLGGIWSGADKRIFGYTEIEIVNELIRRGEFDDIGE